MILEEKTKEETGRSYADCPIRIEVWLKCDYCGVTFKRIKKNRQRNNRTIDKDSCLAKECRKKKQKEVNLKLYGCENSFQSEEVKAKTKTTNMERYGTEEYFASADFSGKREETLQDRYGVDSPLQCEEIKKKQRQTCKEKFGVENIAQHESFPDILKAAIQAQHGVDSCMQLQDCKDKRSKTCEERYGEYSYTKTDAYKKKIKQTCLEKYGVDHPSKVKEHRDKAKATSIQRYGVPYYTHTEEFKSRYVSHCIAKWGVPNPLCLQQNRKFGKTQQGIGDWLNSFGFNFHQDYTVLEGKELDLYDKDQAVAIEYCGLYWHTEQSLEPRLRPYHHNKFTSCVKKGIHLITMFEDEWKANIDVCKSLLKSILGLYERRLYARQCEVKEIDSPITRDFCNEHHLRGGSNLTHVSFGLFAGDLVGVLSLGRHPRYSGQLVLDRLCFAKDVQVVGGASKLFKHCRNWLEQKGIGSVTSWSDNRWSLGKIYKNLGFNLDKELPPDYSYVNLARPYCRLSKQSQRKSCTDCPKDVTERNWLAQQGLARIWDCGKKRWVYSISSS